ncbi:hypothetical protein ABIE63_002766 [Limibacillus sp. MBR-115]
MLETVACRDLSGLLTHCAVTCISRNSARPITVVRVEIRQGGKVVVETVCCEPLSTGFP